MAIDLSIAAHQVADEEARAEVDVLNSRLEQTSQLTRKIQACLGRLEASSQRVREVAGPLNGETQRLQLLGHNVDAVLGAIQRLRQPADSKDDEQSVIRSGPENAGLSGYLASLDRLNKSLLDMQSSNLRATQHTMNDLTRLLKAGNSQLESHFERLLQTETPRLIEPLQFVAKDKPFPVLSQDLIARLGLIYSHLVSQQGSNHSSSVAGKYAAIRGPYLSQSLANSAAASVSSAKKKNSGAIYRPGTNSIEAYAQAMKGLFLSEYDNVCSIFARDDWGPLFRKTCEAALTELARTIRELNAHVKTHLGTDCCLAYEVTEIISGLSDQIGTRTGELKASISDNLKPIRETAKASLPELLEETKRRIGNLQTLPPDGSPVPIVSETVQRLQAMHEFQQPIASILVFLDDGGWRAGASFSGRSGDAVPSISHFDIGADGREFFKSYCSDTIDNLLSALCDKALAIFGKNKAATGVFLGNCTVVVERMLRDSDLGKDLDHRMAPTLDKWRKKATGLYTDMCKDLSIYLFDSIHTNRSQRPASGQADSASVVKGLSSKDKDRIKEKFLQFNGGFDDMVAKHGSFAMEKEVRSMLGDDIRQKLQPLYDRFWDRYHEIDKGRGKYVKYDKSGIAAIFAGLSA
ncbi:hypothetical protein CP533_3414 [Ophiocordyceps camponoti-saundersi (nom. inval.)]|nr:hypothetical protein CP533_3414 [Ophiocordyceps camponoti-saundersi (nom. inval.)]